jgi:hypothetical protein
VAKTTISKELERWKAQAQRKDDALFSVMVLAQMIEDQESKGLDIYESAALGAAIHALANEALMN